MNAPNLITRSTNEKMWDEYRNLREDAFRNDKSPAIATEFYRQHQEEMDLGATPAWKEDSTRTRLAPTQHAMNLLFRDAPSFHAEYQNEPTYASGDEQTPKSHRPNPADEQLQAGQVTPRAANGLRHSLTYNTRYCIGS